MTTDVHPHPGVRPESARARVLRDVAIRVVGIPFFGIVIPRATGVLEGMSKREGFYWFSSLCFFVLSLVVWQGNRWLLMRRRADSGWLAEPRRKLLKWLLAHLAYTTVVTVLAMVLWYHSGPLHAIDWPHLLAVTAVVVACVLLVTHAYETVFLIQDRLEDRLELEQLERARLLAELETAKSQLTPHFLFNGLHVLGVLITEDPVKARRFNQHMAEVCRYLLHQQQRDLVPLREELEFIDSYFALIRLRFPESVQIELRDFDRAAGWLIPPASLQLLLENAIKHNAFNDAAPLRIELSLGDRAITVSNATRLFPAPPSSAKVGLRNLQERYRLTVGEDVRVSEVGGRFIVTLPLVSAPRN